MDTNEVKNDNTSIELINTETEVIGNNVNPDSLQIENSRATFVVDLYNERNDEDHDINQKAFNDDEIGRVEIKDNELKNEEIKEHIEEFLEEDLKLHLEETKTIEENDVDINNIPSTDNQSQTRKNRKSKKSKRLPLHPRTQSNEEILDKEIGRMYCDEFVACTSNICEENMQAARTMIQCTLATNRIVSQSISSTRTDQARQLSQFDSQLITWPLSPVLHSPDQHCSKENSSEIKIKISKEKPQRAKTSCEREREPWRLSFHGIQREKPPEEKFPNDNENENEEYEKLRNNKPSDHRLSNCDNPIVLKWLQRKNSTSRHEQRTERERLKVEHDLNEELNKIRVRRMEMASESFANWLENKNRQAQTSRSKIRDSRPKSSNSCSSFESDDEDFVTLSPFRSSRPIHNYVFRRPTSAISHHHETVPQINNHSKKPHRMRISGQKLTVNYTERHSGRPVREVTKLSYDEWVKNKKVVVPAGLPTSPVKTSLKEQLLRQKSQTSALKPIINKISTIKPKNLRPKSAHQRFNRSSSGQNFTEFSTEGFLSLVGENNNNNNNNMQLILYAAADVASAVEPDHITRFIEEL